MAEPVKSRPNTLRENLMRWQTLANNARVQAAGDVPGLADHLAALEEVLTRITTSLHDQEVHVTKVRELLRARREDVATARDLRQRVSGFLIGHYGRGSEKLRQFGIKPKIAGARRKSAEVPEAPAPAPAPAPSASA